jgi:hypothetical protein
MADSRVMALITDYAAPQWHTERSESNEVVRLLRANILRPAGANEQGWLRTAAEKAAGIAASPNLRSPELLSLADAFAPPAPEVALPTETMVLSTYLAVADLVGQSVLVTHPLGQPPTCRPPCGRPRRVSPRPARRRSGRRT